MPRTRSLAWAELKIGVLTIVAIGITAVLIFSLTGGRGFFWQRYTLKTRFPDAAGLSEGSPVRVAGVQVGSVKAVELSDEHVEVTFDLNKSVRDKITDRSTAVMGSVSLLGQSSVDITPATAGTPIPEWGYVPLGHIKGQLADVADQASTGIDQITKLVADVRAGRGTVGKLLNDPASANALEASLKNVADITQRINAGDGSLGKLLKDEAFADSLAASTANLRQLTDKINRGDGTVGKLMTDAALYNRINSVTTRLDDLVTKLNEGQGTAGQLLKDKQLYENMNKTIVEMQGLLADIRRDPKKYLNVRVSVF